MIEVILLYYYNIKKINIIYNIPVYNKYYNNTIFFTNINLIFIHLFIIKKTNYSL